MKGRVWVESLRLGVSMVVAVGESLATAGTGSSPFHREGKIPKVEMHRSDLRHVEWGCKQRLRAPGGRRRRECAGRSSP